MTRRLGFWTALAAALALTPLMTTVVDAQTAVSMSPNDEKEICAGVKATVTGTATNGALRTVGDPNGDAPVRILYKAKDTTTAVTDTLTCVVGDKKQPVTITVTPPTRSDVSGFSTQAYPEAFKALFLLFVLAIVLESGLAILFNWRPFVETFNARAVRPLVSFVFALLLVYKFGIDLVTSLARLINPSVPALDDTGKLLTAMVIAGGSAGVNNLMVGLGFRQQRTPETVAPKPPANEGWISVAIIRTANIEGPVTVRIGVEDPGTHLVPVVASLDGSTRPGLRYFLRDRGRFPGSGGHAVAKGDSITVKVSAQKRNAARGTLVEDSWGPHTIGGGAIIDLTFKL